MRLIIAGSRDIHDYEALKLAMVNSTLWGVYGKRIEVVCGMARGADALGKLFAERNGLKVHEYPAQWDAYGKSAGYRRNQAMANDADGLLLLWDGKSKGSNHMLDIAIAKDLEIHAYTYHGRDLPSYPEHPIIERIM